VRRAREIVNVLAWNERFLAQLKAAGHPRKDNAMRLVISATAVIFALSATPGFARDYPWCARTSSNGFNGGCYFTTYRQCQATVSGQGGDCRINPRVAFDQQNRGNRRRGFGY
jgi:hypothetical protein